MILSGWTVGWHHIRAQWTDWRTKHLSDRQAADVERRIVLISTKSTETDAESRVGWGETTDAAVIYQRHSNLSASCRSQNICSLSPDSKGMAGHTSRKYNLAFF